MDYPISATLGGGVHVDGIIISVPPECPLLDHPERLVKVLRRAAELLPQIRNLNRVRHVRANYGDSLENYPSCDPDYLAFAWEMLENPLASEDDRKYCTAVLKRHSERGIGRNLSNGLRAKVFRRDDGRCRYCGKRFDGAMHIDHVQPRSRGGMSVQENLVVACANCNTKKKNRTPEEAGMRLMPEPVMA